MNIHFSFFGFSSSMRPAFCWMTAVFLLLHICVLGQTEPSSESKLAFANYHKYYHPDDAAELHDLASTYPAMVKQLADLLTKKLKAANAPMPVYKATGKAVPWPNE